jgi:hypothetical protein
VIATNRTFLFSQTRTQFAETFMVSERNLTKEAEAQAEGRKKGGRFKKLTAEVCNVHRLWKLFGPIILRRRKQDSGVDIVPKVRKVIRCQMAEGHSFHLANNVILLAYSWAADKFKQALDRVHRLNSVKPVNIYVVICDGSIDRKLESLTDEKTDAAELVLDGRLIGERGEEINLAELLKIARREFNDKTNTIDEGLLQAEWPKLRDRLAVAMRHWDILDAPESRSTDAPLTVPSPLPPGEPVRLSMPKARMMQTSRMDRHDPFSRSKPEPDQPDNVIPFPVQVPEWKARMRERAGRLGLRRSDMWSQLQSCLSRRAQWGFARYPVQKSSGDDGVVLVLAAGGAQAWALTLKSPLDVCRALQEYVYWPSLRSNP